MRFINLSQVAAMSMQIINEICYFPELNKGISTIDSTV